MNDVDQSIDDTENQEKLVAAPSGFCMLFVSLAILFIGVLILLGGIIGSAMGNASMVGLFVLLPFILIALCTICGGLVAIQPNTAVLLQFCGKYVGTVKRTGYIFINPYYSKTMMSLKAQNFETTRSKVNDANGTPIEIQCVIVWRIRDTYKATFEVEDYYQYVRIQCESALRTCAAMYPYESNDDDALSLRGSPAEIAESLRNSVTDRVKKAGIEVIEAKISHLAYSTEIASAMLRKQQAQAVIQAREKIVKGACGMVQMAIEELEKNNVAELDAEKKAKLVSNLLIVLCGEEKAQPVVNTNA
jgi:regulator of protease activity HflC (stomatin/prohibitin superfamily)